MQIQYKINMYIYATLGLLPNEQNSLEHSYCGWVLD